jgi:hypothetical protein
VVLTAQKTYQIHVRRLLICKNKNKKAKTFCKTTFGDFLLWQFLSLISTPISKRYRSQVRKKCDTHLQLELFRKFTSIRPGESA